MRVVILYHKDSDHSGIVTDYVTEFQNYKRKKLELVSLESEQGDNMAKIYGISRYPAVLVMKDDGSILRLWQGLPMPLMDELSYYYVEQSKLMVSRAGKTIMPLTTSVAPA